MRILPVELIGRCPEGHAVSKAARVGATPTRPGITRSWESGLRGIAATSAVSPSLFSGFGFTPSALGQEGIVGRGKDGPPSRTPTKCSTVSAATSRPSASARHRGHARKQPASSICRGSGTNGGPIAAQRCLRRSPVRSAAMRSHDARRRTSCATARSVTASGAPSSSERIAG